MCEERIDQDMHEISTPHSKKSAQTLSECSVWMVNIFLTVFLHSFSLIPQLTVLYMNQSPNEIGYAYAKIAQWHHEILRMQHCISVTPQMHTNK